MKTKLVIFDLDGTLLDTFGDLRAAVNEALLKNALPPRTLREVKRFVGDGVRKLVERAVPSGTNVAMTESVFRDFIAAYRVKKNETTAPYDGVVSLLSSLRESGVKTAVLSNKPDFAVKELMEELLLPVDCARGEREGAARKPDPEGVKEILLKFGAEKEDTLFVGDSETDAQTARNAGLRFAAVLWGAREKSDFEGFSPEVFFETAAELNDWILNVWALK